MIEDYQVDEIYSLAHLRDQYRNELVWPKRFFTQEKWNLLHDEMHDNGISPEEESKAFIKFNRETGGED